MSRRRRKPVTLAPGGEGRLLLRPVEVDDPYETSAKLVVMKNVRCTPIDQMLHQGRIDTVQHQAANRFQRLCEMEMIGSSGAIDYGRARVDGGQIAQTVTMRTIEAHSEMVDVYRAIGEIGYRILWTVLAEGLPIRRLVVERPGLAFGMSGKRAEGYVSGRIVEALDMLVSYWGMIAEGSQRRSGQRLRVSRETVTGPATEWTVGRYGHLEPVEKPAQAEAQVRPAKARVTETQKKLQTG
jgi:hypothetical protein